MKNNNNKMTKYNKVKVVEDVIDIIYKAIHLSQNSFLKAIDTEDKKETVISLIRDDLDIVRVQRTDSYSVIRVIAAAEYIGYEESAVINSPWEIITTADVAGLMNIIAKAADTDPTQEREDIKAVSRSVIYDALERNARLLLNSNINHYVNKNNFHKLRAFHRDSYSSAVDKLALLDTDYDYNYIFSLIETALAHLTVMLLTKEDIAVAIVDNFIR